jgi:hypothetical protein
MPTRQRTELLCGIGAFALGLLLLLIAYLQPHGSSESMAFLQLVDKTEPWQATIPVGNTRWARRSDAPRTETFGTRGIVLREARPGVPDGV